MKFADYVYKRPNMKDIEEQFDVLLDDFQSAKMFDKQDAVIGKINNLRNGYESMAEIAGIRHTIDTTDEFYEKEQDYFDETQPIYKGLITRYYRALVDSPFRNELESKWGKQLFRLAEVTLKTFSPEVVEDLQRENKLSSEYTKLIASAKIAFDGKELNLSQLGPYLRSTDRDIRKQASKALNGFFEENEQQLDEIYDKLVKVRTTIARKLGFENFVELGYARLRRTDYDAEMVARFRRQVEETIVPLATKLREKQRLRIGVDELKYYDEAISFKTGNAVPKGDPEWIVANAQRMYAEMAPETDEFFRFMYDNELMDLVAKKGKAAGGYCTYIGAYKSPFIFSNFNGTSGDIDVLTHEGGHAFQAYQSRAFETPEYQFPTYEAAEIHSMSMEFFAWPWMDSFFKEDAEKYRYDHLSEALLFVPYGVAIDEFQHAVYENPDMSPAERKAVWRDIERKYLPHRDYDDNGYLERGGYWHRQGHVFGDPFYYIDYTLAQICAFQFWKRMHEDQEAAWRDYLALCKQGGSQSFVELIKVAHLNSPFEDGCLRTVIEEIDRYLDQIDDSKL
ncbi:M3 family oligoendopeptidase [Camelliibacillus cellulosilyticus]|uniref:M3 family oligoendopeptidase n=1 Tax=Camelliibacillus cellulosilyticus TaxID=2174486 RepID=A0ABV9GLE6_9BACL